MKNVIDDFRPKTKKYSYTFKVLIETDEEISKDMAYVLQKNFLKALQKSFSCKVPDMSLIEDGFRGAYALEVGDSQHLYANCIKNMKKNKKIKD